MVSSAGDYVLRPTELRLKNVALVIFVMALPIAANRIDTDFNPSECGEREPQGRIYQGEPISKENIPWMVAVITSKGKSKRSSLCGGSIITSNVILTAAHCLMTRNGRYLKKVMVVYNYTLSLAGKNTALYAEKVIAHPTFVKRRAIVHDVALLKLPVDLEFNRYVKPVCLPTDKMDIAGKSLVIAGWGITETGKGSKTLRYAEVIALTDEECQAQLRRTRNPDTRLRARPGPAICAFAIGTGACRGESGGPLTLMGDDGRTVQVGISSMGDGRCPPRTPPVYTRVSSHVQWIEDALNKPRMWRKLKRVRKPFTVRLK